MTATFSANSDGVRPLHARWSNMSALLEGRPAAMNRLLTLAFCLLTCTVAGCGKSDPRELVSVSGIVKYEGAPVEEGTIMFINPTTQDTHQGNLGSGGEYSLDVVRGNYKVVIEPVMEEKQAGPEIAPETVYKTVDNIPEKYRRSESTDLTANVEDEGEFSFEMKKQPIVKKPVPMPMRRY
jgi:hypothetical protein